MMDIDDEMTHMIDRYNRTKVYELELESGLKWLGADGPIYRCHPIAVRALFVGPDGRHWGDACLAIESGWPATEVRDCLAEMFSGGDCPLFETWIFTPWRGKHSALIVPIDEIADVLDLDEPQRSTDTWARGWGALPTVTDGHERALVVEARRTLAGRPLACYCPQPEPGETDTCHAALLIRVAAGEQP